VTQPVYQLPAQPAIQELGLAELEPGRAKLFRPGVPNGQGHQFKTQGAFGAQFKGVKTDRSKSTDNGPNRGFRTLGFELKIWRVLN
jgi:hypothetical protein